MNRQEYNQNMINFGMRNHGHIMKTCLYNYHGLDSKYDIYNEIHELIVRESGLAAVEAQAERSHALRFNHVLNRQARVELMKREWAKRKEVA